MRLLLNGCLIALLLVCFFFQEANGKNPRKKFFRKAHRFFRKNVEDGKVDYVHLKKQPENLDALVGMIEDFPVSEYNPDVQKAFYINAYNLLLIKSIIQREPVLYPLEYRGLFSMLSHKVAGEELTLNQIENQKLIRPFKDLRVLFVLSSASEGAIPLADFAYKPKKLEKQFEKVVKHTANNTDYVRVMKKSSKILLAESLRRSTSDFKREELLLYLNKYRQEPLPTGFAIDFYPANRKLNRVH